MNIIEQKIKIDSIEKQIEKSQQDIKQEIKELLNLIK